jgi:hypothetical protein
MATGEFPPRLPSGSPLMFTCQDQFKRTFALPAYIVADSAFALGPHCIKPFPYTADSASPNFLFNKVQSRARQNIEQAWGMLVNRFRVWKATCEIGGRNWDVRVAHAIEATMILHNIAIDYADYADGTTKIIAEFAMFLSALSLLLRSGMV